MTKIVINNQHGGFSLSDAATELYLNLRGLAWTKKTDPNWSFFGLNYYTTSPGEEDQFFSSRNISRTDETLIKIIEQLGDEANGDFASLEIIDLQPGTKYRIQEYDGSEWIETESDIEWSIA